MIWAGMDMNVTFPVAVMTGDPRQHGRAERLQVQVLGLAGEIVMLSMLVLS